MLLEPELGVRCNCAKKFNHGAACTVDAGWFVEIHPVDWCDRAGLNENGNVAGFLCYDHLKLYEHRAIDKASSVNPTGYSRLWRSSRPYCQTCRRSIRTGADILQIAITLPLPYLQHHQLPN